MITTAPRSETAGLRRAGAVAALVEAATFVFGIALFATVLADYTSDDLSLAESVAFVADHQGALHAWYVVIFIVFGIALVPLVLALHERIRAGEPALARVATSFGLVWTGLVLAAGMIANLSVGAVADLAETDPTAAASVWSALDTVTSGLGGGNEVAGGVWVLLVSWAALRTRALPRALNVLGVASGAAGLVTVVPGLEPVGMVFGLGLIAWFVWVGLELRRPDAIAR